MAERPLHENAKLILRIISRMEGEVSTDKITSQSGLRNDLVNYHIKTLIERELVDKIGTDDSVNAPIPANTYDVTPAGEEKAQEIRMEVNEQPDVGGDEAERIAELEETVENLKRRDEVRLDQIDELKEQVEKHRNAIKRIAGNS